MGITRTNRDDRGAGAGAEKGKRTVGEDGDGAGAGHFSGAVVVSVCWPADNGHRPAAGPGRAGRRSRIVNPSSGYRATHISMRHTDVVSPAAEPSVRLLTTNTLMVLHGGL